MAELSAFERTALGGTAGCISVMCKFLAQDFNLVKSAASLSADQIFNLQVGYLVLTPILVIIGGFIGWISQEDNKMKLVALAISAPALFTTMAGGGDRTVNTQAPPIPVRVLFIESLIPAAYAQKSTQINSPQGQHTDTATAARQAQPKPEAQIAFDPSVGRLPPPKEPQFPTAPEDVSTAERVRRGVSAWFGYGIEPPKYRVTVGSYVGPISAQRFADSINKSDPELTAIVYPPKGESNYYSVVLGGYASLPTAKKLKETALERGYTDAWISPERK